MLVTRFSQMTEGCALCPAAFDGKCEVVDETLAESGRKQVETVFLHECKLARGMEDNCDLETTRFRMCVACLSTRFDFACVGAVGTELR